MEIRFTVLVPVPFGCTLPSLNKEMSSGCLWILGIMGESRNFLVMGELIGIRTTVITNGNSLGEIMFNKKKINVRILSRVLTNKITHVVQWSKLTYFQPIIIFVLEHQLIN